MQIIHPHERKAIAKQIADEVDVYCQVTYDGGHRSHLGASLIGEECERQLWYVFRWVKHVIFSGRMQRLFQRGHLEEFRFMEYLRGIGFQVFEYDTNLPLKDGKPQQFRITGSRGHFGGSLDGIGIAPERFRLPGPVLLECKTNKEGKDFEKIVKNDDIKETKPRHFVQMSIYGRNYGFLYALYQIVNKNDDDIHYSLVELDWQLAADMERKADRIIFSEKPPRRIKEDATYYKCKQCDFHDICHTGADYERNCRSCDYASPSDNGEWTCNLVSQIIPKEFIPLGCSAWHPVGR